MAKIISLANQKGGVSKTSTAHLLALGLKQQGYKVLLVDLDPQTNLTFIAGAYDKTPTIYEVLTSRSDAKGAIFTGGNVDIIPGSTDLMGADMEFSKTGREYMLREALEPLNKAYDVILIDCPPALGVLTVNALTASNSTLIPCGADILSIQGFSQLYDLIGSVKKYSNKKLNISGLVVTRYDTRTKLSKDFTSELERISDKLKVHLYDTKLREGVAVKRYQADNTDPYRAEAQASVIKDYIAFIGEIKEREGLK